MRRRVLLLSAGMKFGQLLILQEERIIDAAELAFCERVLRTLARNALTGSLTRGVKC
jgi:hypothetical protein